MHIMLPSRLLLFCLALSWLFSWAVANQAGCQGAALKVEKQEAEVERLRRELQAAEAVLTDLHVQAESCGISVAGTGVGCRVEGVDDASFMQREVGSRFTSGGVVPADESQEHVELRRPSFPSPRVP